MIFEFLIAFLLGTILTLCCVKLVIDLSRFYKLVQDVSQQTASICQVGHCLWNDFSCIPYDDSLWKRLESAYVIWTHRGVDYGYKLVNKRLMRIVGTYDRLTKSWVSRTTSTVLMPVDSFEVIVQGGPLVSKLVEIKIVFYGKSYVFWIRGLTNVYLMT